MKIGPYHITHDGRRYIVKHDGCIHYYVSSKYLMPDLMKDTRLTNLDKDKVLMLEGMKKK